MHEPLSNPTTNHGSHFVTDLELLFKNTFYNDYNTTLCGGALEPEYLPADDEQLTNRLVYREDFFASALHEIAHWCIAGARRREQIDFGYWYEAEGRDSEKQTAFFAVEVKPQALELLFSLCAGFAFKVSADNTGLAIDPLPFAKAVLTQAQLYCKEGMPHRAWQFCLTLIHFYQPEINAVGLAGELRQRLKLLHKSERDAQKIVGFA